MIAEGGCVNAFRYIESFKIELRGSIEHVPDLAPVDEVAAVEDGHAGIERKRRRDEVIVCTDPKNTGIGIETGDDRVPVLMFIRAVVIEDRIAPLVFEPRKRREPHPHLYSVAEFLRVP